MSDNSVHRVPVLDIKQEHERLLKSRGLIDVTSTGKFILELDFHRGSLNSMKMTKTVTL